MNQMLTQLRESIIDKLPLASGTLQLPASQLSLFYKIAGEGHNARHVDFVNATSNELEQLAQACEPASFGVKGEDVLDETYQKARKLDPGLFSTPLVPEQTDLVKVIRGYLLEGTDSTRKLKVELNRLKVYGQGSFFKSHVDTPRSQKMFGSLVVVFPTPHEGGVLLTRHRGQECAFDSAAALSTAPPSSIGYAAFFSDVEHEVTPVVSGHRVTLTYNLYFDDDDGRKPAPAGGSISEPTASVPAQVMASEQGFRSAFQALLEDPNSSRMALEGGRGLEHVYGLLKGSDATVYRATRALGLEPVLYLYYESRPVGTDFFETGLIDRVIDTERCDEVESFISTLADHGGFPLRLMEAYGKEPVETVVHWVTPVTTFNRQSSAYVAYGNDASLGLAYGDVCLILRIGKAGDRLSYPTVAQLKEEWEEKKRQEMTQMRRYVY